jgi:hypothetical protein
MEWVRKLKGLVPKRVSSIIDATLALTLLAFGIYIDSPYYESSPTTIIGAAFESDLARLIISLLYIVPPILVFVGYQTNRIRVRSVGLFSVFLAYLFNTILRVATFGIQPVNWIFTLALCVIAAAMFINFKLKLEVD